MMPRPILATVAIAAALLLPVLAAGAPRDVVRDYFADGQINGAHSVQERAPYQHRRSRHLWATPRPMRPGANPAIPCWCCRYTIVLVALALVAGWHEIIHLTRREPLASASQIARDRQAHLRRRLHG